MDIIGVIIILALIYWFFVSGNNLKEKNKIQSGNLDNEKQELKTKKTDLINNQVGESHKNTISNRKIPQEKIIGGKESISLTRVFRIIIWLAYWCFLIFLLIMAMSYASKWCGKWAYLLVLGLIFPILPFLRDIAKGHLETVMLIGLTLWFLIAIVLNLSGGEESSGFWIAVVGPLMALSFVIYSRSWEDNHRSD